MEHHLFRIQNAPGVPRTTVRLVLEPEAQFHVDLTLHIDPARLQGPSLQDERWQMLELAIGQLREIIEARREGPHRARLGVFPFWGRSLEILRFTPVLVAAASRSDR